jgi:feruloyl esterase
VGCVPTEVTKSGISDRSITGKRPIPGPILFAALTVSLLATTGPAMAATCASLANLTLPDTTITAAQSVGAGTYTAPDGTVLPDLPAFCRIAATLTPTSDSNIKIEVWMPFSGWRGIYWGTGNDNIGGNIVYRRLGVCFAAPRKP